MDQHLSNPRTFESQDSRSSHDPRSISHLITRKNYLSSVLLHRTIAKVNLEPIALVVGPREKRPAHDRAWGFITHTVAAAAAAIYLSAPDLLLFHGFEFNRFNSRFRDTFLFHYEKNTF